MIQLSRHYVMCYLWRTGFFGIQGCQANTRASILDWSNIACSSFRILSPCVSKIQKSKSVCRGSYLRNTSFTLQSLKKDMGSKSQSTQVAKIMHHGNNYVNEAGKRGLHLASKSNRDLHTFFFSKDQALLELRIHVYLFLLVLQSVLALCLCLLPSLALCSPSQPSSLPYTHPRVLQSQSFFLN